MAQIDVSNKIVKAEVTDKEFTNRETGEMIKYRRLIVTVNFGDEEEVIEFVPATAEGKAGYKLLIAADEV